MIRLERTLCFLLYLSFSAAEEPGYKYFALGQPGGAVRKTVPGYALMGGGQDQDAAFQWMCDHAGGGNFLVLRASGTDAYNPYVRNLCPALSAVETLIITSREGASQPFVAEKIRAAAAVFIAGGSQDNYINFWRGTPVEEAINSAITRGVPVGGTSAGLAVLGEYSFAALKDTVKSSEALANPFHERVTITRDFLHIPLLDGKNHRQPFCGSRPDGKAAGFFSTHRNGRVDARAFRDWDRRKDRGSCGGRWQRASDWCGRRLFSSHTRSAGAVCAEYSAHVSEYFGVPIDRRGGTVQREVVERE